MTTILIEEMLQRVKPVTRAIVEAVIAEQLGVDDLGGVAFVPETAAVMEQKLGHMSRFMASAMLGATLFFDRSALPRGGAFTSLSLPERRAHLAAWRAAALPFFRDFVMFWEKMTTFAFYCFREAEVGHHVDESK